MGRFKIYTVNHKVLTIKGRTSKNGNNVHIWEKNSGKWNEWYLIDAETGKKFIPYEYFPFSTYL